MSNAKTKWVSFRLPADRHGALTTEAMFIGFDSIAAALREQVERMGLDVVRNEDYMRVSWQTHELNERVTRLSVEAAEAEQAKEKAERLCADAVKSEYDARNELEGASRSARTFLWLAIAATSTVAAPAAIAIHNYTHRHASTWHTTPAPVNTPVTIQADAYFDGHVWRSYDLSPIPT